MEMMILYALGTMSLNDFFNFFFSASIARFWLMLRAAICLSSGPIMTQMTFSSSVDGGVGGFLIFTFRLYCLHFLGHRVNLMSPVFQLISGLWILSQVSPRIIGIFPSPHTKNRARSEWPLMNTNKSTVALILPL